MIYTHVYIYKYMINIHMYSRYMRPRAQVALRWTRWFLDRASTISGFIARASPAVSIRQHTSAYVSIFQHTQAPSAASSPAPRLPSVASKASCTSSLRPHTLVA